jgi:hypothetical protein
MSETLEDIFDGAVGAFFALGMLLTPTDMIKAA